MMLKGFTNNFVSNEQLLSQTCFAKETGENAFDSAINDGMKISNEAAPESILKPFNPNAVVEARVINTPRKLLERPGDIRIGDGFTGPGDKKGDGGDDFRPVDPGMLSEPLDWSKMPYPLRRAFENMGFVDPATDKIWRDDNETDTWDLTR